MATGSEIQLVVITPERQVVDRRVNSVVFTAHDGELGVLHDRAPLMCALGIGQVRFTADGKTQRVFIDGGFAQVHDNVVTVLTARALQANEVTPAVVEAADRAAADIPADTPAEDRLAAQQRARVLRQFQSTN